MAQPILPPAKTPICFDDIRELLVDFGLPFLVLVILTILLATGIDGEIKTLFAGVVGWIIKSGVSRRGKKTS